LKQVYTVMHGRKNIKQNKTVIYIQPHY